MSSMVPAGSIFPARREDVSEPCRPTDFLFRVLLRSSRKLGWAGALPLGEVGGGKGELGRGGGDRGGACGAGLARRSDVAGRVFFREPFPQEELLSGGGGGVGAVWGWGLTTATLGTPL